MPETKLELPGRNAQPGDSGQSDSARLLRLATLASVVTATVLVGLKLVAWGMTGSVSVLASLVDSLMDTAASSINFFAVRYALMPADAEHRFGHGKAEPLAGLGQATFIAGSAVFLVLHAIDRLLNPHALESVGVGFGVMGLSLIATLALVLFQRRVIATTGSTAIRADSLHYRGDLLTNLSIIVALGLTALGFGRVDPLLAIAVACYILYNAWGIAVESVDLLMDRELPADATRRIAQLARRHPEVRGIHDLRSRQSGRDYFVQLHLELDDTMPLVRAHRIADEVEAAIRAEFPAAEVIIHQDPVSEAPHPEPGGDRATA